MWDEAARSLAGSRRSMFRRVPLIALSIGCLAAAGCKRARAPSEQAPKQETSQPSTSLLPNASTSLLPDEKGATKGSGQGTLALPTGFGKRTGDLDERAKARTIRALVILSPISFFYEAGKPHGIEYEALEEFQKFANQKLNTGKLPISVVFLPMRPDQLESALTQGLGDIIAHGIVITPEREQRVAFSTPIQTDVSQVVVTGSALANVSSFDDLAGKSIYVNPLTTYYDNLRKLSDTQQKAGKQPLTIKSADKNLSDDDLIEMVNAGLIPATVTTGGVPIYGRRCSQISDRTPIWWLPVKERSPGSCARTTLN